MRAPNSKSAFLVAATVLARVLTLPDREIHRSCSWCATKNRRGHDDVRYRIWANRGPLIPQSAFYAPPLNLPGQRIAPGQRPYFLANASQR
jgi:hypothetical protein